METCRRRPAHPALRGVASFCLAGTLALGGCGERGADQPLDPTTAAVVESLEGLAFVPSGRTALDIDIRVDVDLLVDRFELTGTIWKDLFGDEDPRPQSFGTFVERQVGAVAPGAWSSQAPAVGMTLDEAREAARRRGMRLPTFEEWLWCAAGPRSRRFPAGRQQRGLANTLDLGLVRPTPVGAFESGQTPDTGLFDLLGNVWEWTEPPPPPVGWRTIDADSWPASGGTGAPAWVMGGSFATPEQVLFTRDGVALARGTTPGHRASDVGMRCVADATPFLVDLARRAGGLRGAARERVVAVGARWGGRSMESLWAAQLEAPGHPWIEALLEGAGGGRAGGNVGEVALPGASRRSPR